MGLFNWHDDHDDDDDQGHASIEPEDLTNWLQAQAGSDWHVIPIPRDPSLWDDPSQEEG